MRKELIADTDPYRMNWIEGATEWGTVRAPEQISVEECCREEDGIITERYTFTNMLDKPVFTSLADIGIYTPFNDDYCGSDICTKMRCHTHIYCGGEIAYVMALRMGGEAPHLGLVLTKGSLGGYSVERDLSRISNDRGDFILHPAPAALNPGESFTIEWKLFWHEGKEDFYQKLSRIHPGYIDVQADNYVVFSGEMVRVCVDGEEKLCRKASEPGPHTYTFRKHGVEAKCAVNVLPPFKELLEKRVHYIAEKQQLHKENCPLDGAYLIYDTKEEHIYYRAENDYNGGRERVGMGILMAAYLQRFPDERLRESLDQYLAYVERELYDDADALVTNDYGYDNSFHRLYNYPWMSLFFLENYKLRKDVNYLYKAYKVMASFYAQGGDHFYAIAIPLEKLMKCLAEEKMQKEYEELLECFRRHCDILLQNDILYPAHEVNYEQSIVAPAANLLLEMYLLTGEAKYREGGRRQLEILELFNARQPHYLQYEVAIRHWDGYWFGKKRQYGDTYPHYWSALTGNAYRLWHRVSGDEKYLRMAEGSLRGVLSLFFPDGSASCAYVFPVTVNGEAGQRYDDYANDQDWGMYFYLVSHMDAD